MNAQNNSSPASPVRYGPNLFWPIVLIGIGIILLLSNVGVLTVNPLPYLWRFWPVILIVIGVDILLGRRGPLSAVVSAVLGLLVVGGVIALLLVAQNNPAALRTSPLFAVPELKSQNIVRPMGGLRTADVQIDLGSGHGTVHALNDSPNLFEADVHYYGELVNTFSTNGDNASIHLGTRGSGIDPFFIGNDESWDIRLNPSPTYDLHINTGSGTHSFDLGSLTLSGLDLNHGSGSITINLPKTGQYNFQVNVGSGNVVINVPSQVAVRVQTNVGSGSFNAPNLHRVSGTDRDGTYESSNFSSSGPNVTINLSMGSGTVTVR